MSARDVAGYLRRQLADAFLTTSPFVQRFLLSMFLVVYGVSIYFTPPELWFTFKTLAAHRAIAPQNVWAALYTVSGFLCFWRVTDPHARPVVAIFTNTFAVVLLSLSASLAAVSRSPFWAMFAYATMNAVWVLLRTGYSALDKTRA